VSDRAFYYKGFITSSLHIRQHELGLAIQMYWKGIKEQPFIHQAINGVSGANYFPRSVLFIKRIAEIHSVPINRREQVLFAKELQQVMLLLSAYESTEKIASHLVCPKRLLSIFYCQRQMLF
jgi:hypothetical protein